MKVAVLGSGIAGLGAAYYLSRSFEVHVFEKDDRIGGHTHTVATPDGTRVDTGFIVHNRVNYPRFVRLMEELGVETGPSDMSFAYDGGALPWCSRGLNGVLTKRSHVLSPRFWCFWREVVRFNTWGERAAREGLAEGLSLKEALDREGFSADFREAYLVPMAGAVWSTPARAMGDFPALTLLRFFWNHGMLGFASQHPWRTIPGGTSTYLDPITRPFSDRIMTGARIQSVHRDAEGVTLTLQGQEPQRFDHVVFACHGDQVLPMLADASDAEREILGAFRTNPTPTWLHTDTSILPKARRGWASWNFRKVADERLLLTYHMNRLQTLGTAQDLLVTLHGEGLVDEAQVIRKLDYEHPRYDLAAVQAQKRWPEISRPDRRTHFAGAYWTYGFHEDGLASGIRVAESLGIRV